MTVPPLTAWPSAEDEPESERPRRRTRATAGALDRLAQRVAPTAPPSAAPAPPTAPALERVLFVPDTHVPYHDRRAWALVLKMARAWRPDTIVSLGDFADCFAISFHPKTPDREENFDRELAEVNKALDDLDSLGAKRKVYVSGNHEYRLNRYVMQNAPQMHSLLRFEVLTRLSERGWEWVPYRKHVKIGKLNVTHDCGNAGGAAHTKARDSFTGNAMIGHTHRMSVSYSGGAAGESRVGIMVGHLLDAAHVDYMHEIQVSAWQLGFGIGHMQADGTMHLQAIPIIHYRCVVDGVLYEG